MNPINDVQEPGGKAVLVPLTGVDSGGAPISYSFSSSNPSVSLSLVSPTSKSLVLNVTGKDSTNTDFSGTLVLHLFEDLAPNTTAQIEGLVNQGFYTNTEFGRILDGFVAQNTAPSTGVLVDNEILPVLTYTSPGLLAMANAGPDTNDSEFFITGINEKASTSPISLANMPQFLDFKYTIFGQLVQGFDTFEKMITTPVTTNSGTGENSLPLSSVKVTSAQIINDTQNGVLGIVSSSSLNGQNSTITVTATGGGGQTAQRTFQLSVVPDTQVDPPFLGPVPDPTAVTGQPVSFTLTSTDFSNVGVAYTVVNPTTFQAPFGVTVNIDQATGVVTLTPDAGFSGTVNLLAGVRPQSSSDTKANYDTQAFTLTITPLAAPTDLSLDPASDTGNFNDDGYTLSDTPTLLATADPGVTVNFKINGSIVATGTETSPGHYSATVPAGKLSLGPNSITAIASNTAGSSLDSTAINVVYTPSFGQIYTVPGTQVQPNSCSLTGCRGKHRSIMSSAFLSSAGLTARWMGLRLMPLATLRRRLAVRPDRSFLRKAKGAGDTKTVTVQGGQSLGFYLIQNNTTADFLASNPLNDISQNDLFTIPVAFFSSNEANPDSGTQHVQVIADPVTGYAQYNWEDQFGGGDDDFNDIVMTINLVGGSTALPGMLLAPGVAITL